MLRRRDFIRSAALAAAAPVVMPLLGRPGAPSTADAASRAADGVSLHALAGVALAEAERLGCRYADVVVTRRRTGWIVPAARTGAVAEQASLSVEIRVVHSGGFGVDEGSSPTRSAIADVAEGAVANAKADAARAVTNPLTALARGQRTSRTGALDRHTFSDRHRKAFHNAIRRRTTSIVYAEESCFRSSHGRLRRSATLSAV